MQIPSSFRPSDSSFAATSLQISIISHGVAQAFYMSRAGSCSGSAERGSEQEKIIYKYVVFVLHSLMVFWKIVCVRNSRLFFELIWLTTHWTNFAATSQP